jgi:hypothetical protein
MLGVVHLSGVGGAMAVIPIEVMNRRERCGSPELQGERRLLIRASRLQVTIGRGG